MLNSKVVKSFHVDMQAVVRVGATLSDGFEVRNGLRQGALLLLHFSTFTSL